MRPPRACGPAGARCVQRDDVRSAGCCVRQCGTGHYYEDIPVNTGALVGGTLGGFFGGCLFAAAIAYCIVLPRAAARAQIQRLKSIEIPRVVPTGAL